MVMTIDHAVCEYMLDDMVKMLIFGEVIIVKDIDMSSIEYLKYGHFRFIKHMNSSCCLGVHPDFT